MPADNPVQAVKQDLQHTLDAIGLLRGTLANQIYASIGGRLPLGLDESFVHLIKEIDGLADKAEDEMAKAARAFVRFDLPRELRG